MAQYFVVFRSRHHNHIRSNFTIFSLLCIPFFVFLCAIYTTEPVYVCFIFCLLCVDIFARVCYIGSGATENGGRLAPSRESGLPETIETRCGNCWKGGMLMSDYELLSIILAIIAIIVRVIIALINAKK